MNWRRQWPIEERPIRDMFGYSGGSYVPELHRSSLFCVGRPKTKNTGANGRPPTHESGLNLP